MIGPRWIPWAVGAAALVGVTWVALEAAYDRGVTHERTRWTKAEAKAEKAARELAIAHQQETARRYAEQQEAINAAHEELETARRDAARADAAGQRLRAQAERLAAACGASRDPGASSTGAATDAPGAVLADMLRRVDDAAGTVARYADAARIAGQACERSYDALAK